MDFRTTRTITISGFVADANPNKTTPTADKIYTLRGRTDSGSNADAIGFSMAAVFSKASPGATFEDDVAGAKVSFRVWLEDSDGSGKWICASGFSPDDAYHRILKTTADIRGEGRVFVQVLSITSAASADTVRIDVRET